MDIKPSSEKRFALLIDADNVSAKYIKPILEELSKYGTVTYKRIYGDWTLTLHAKWKEVLLDNSITPIQQFAYTQGKNATDSAMIIDAMDILYTNSVEGFCIVSSDSDFTRLVSRIRESGLMVIGMGEKKTPIPFRKACDIFTTLELLLPAPSAKQPDEAKESQSLGTGGHGNGPSIEKVERAVVDIITDNLNNGKATGVGEVGSRLLKRWADFDVRSYGTNQLTKLLGEFKSVRVIKDGNSVAIELTDAAEAVRDAGVKEAAAKEAAREAAGKKGGKDRARDKQDKPDKVAPASAEEGEPADEPASVSAAGETGLAAGEDADDEEVAASAAVPEHVVAGTGDDAAAPSANEAPAASGDSKRPSRRSPRRRHSHVALGAEPAEGQQAAVEEAATALAGEVAVDEAVAVAEPTAAEAPSVEPSVDSAADVLQGAEPSRGTGAPEAVADGSAAKELDALASPEESSVAVPGAAAAASGAAAAAAGPKKSSRKRSGRKRSGRSKQGGEPEQPAANAATDVATTDVATEGVAVVTARESEPAATMPEGLATATAVPVAAPADGGAGAAEAASDLLDSGSSDAGAPAVASRPDDLVRSLVAAAGAQGIGVQELGRKVRAQLRGFKVHDYGFAQLRLYVADVDGVQVEKRGKEWVAFLRDSAE